MTDNTAATTAPDPEIRRILDTAARALSMIRAETPEAQMAAVTTAAAALRRRFAASAIDELSDMAIARGMDVDSLQSALAAGVERAETLAKEPTPLRIVHGGLSEWPDPDMTILRLNRRPPPVLPLSLLGERWATWVEDAAASASAPVDYVVAPLLAAASALIGHSRWAQAWVGWKEPPHLWCASVGDSGDGKSPGADTIQLYILPEIERRMVADFPDTMREKQAEIEAAKIRAENWKEEMRVAIKTGQPLPLQPAPVPREPIEPLLMMSDTTIERVASLLATATPKGVLLTRDELAGWLLGMNTYNDGARAFWLEAYGGRRYRVDRQKSPEPIIVPRFAVSWFGGTQPDKVAEIMQGADDGLLARFMWFWPDPMDFARPKRPPATEWAITALDRLRMLELAQGDNGPAPLTVSLSDAAADRMVDVGRQFQKRRETTAGLTRSAIGKARGLALRLSLVLEYLRWCGEDGYAEPPTVISDDALHAAAAFVIDYVIPSAERTYGDAACSDADRNVTMLARWIAKEKPDAVHVRDLQRSVRLPGLRTADAIHAACKALIEAGWLGMPAGEMGHQRRQTKAYPVSPRLSDR
jgi:Protein of unknown function (DUF3987)